MKEVLVNYTTKPEQTEENARLISAVFEELKSRAPTGICYLAMRDEGGGFSHFIHVEDGAPSLTQFASFRAFQASIGERCLEPPRQKPVTVVGSYNMLPDEVKTSGTGNDVANAK